MRVTISVILLSCAQSTILSVNALGQNQPMGVTAEAGFVAASAGSVPFWLHANQSGVVDPLGTNVYAIVGLRKTAVAKRSWGLRFGTDLVARASNASSFHFKQLYAEARVRFMRVRVGRMTETLGIVDAHLSTGSIASSLNATPMPKLVAMTDGFTPIPFTRGYAEIKAYYAHGWFEDARFVKGAYLHQKSLHVRLGNRLPVSVFGGIVHNAMWGGTSPAPDVGKMPASFEDYLRTVLGRSGGKHAIQSEQIYVLGNHLGVYDLGATATVGNYELLIYRQFIFDDRDGLKLKNPGDGLLGISIRSDRANRIVNHVLYEYLYTKRQSGPEPVGNARDGPGGQDNYYNHYIYRSGWTYYDRSIGSPLMLPYADGEIRNSDRFENNRIVAHHVGLAGNPLPTLAYRLLATYSRNYGTYTQRDIVNERQEPYRFQNGLRQYSFLVEAEVVLSSRHSIWVTTAMAVDAGEVFEDNVGLKIGVVYRPRQHTPLPRDEREWFR